MRDDILQALYGVFNSTQTETNQVEKGTALVCAGSLVTACGKENFPQDALEEFTKFSLVCIQEKDAKL